MSLLPNDFKNTIKILSTRNFIQNLQFDKKELCTKIIKDNLEEDFYFGNENLKYKFNRKILEDFNLEILKEMDMLGQEYQECLKREKTC